MTNQSLHVRQMRKLDLDFVYGLVQKTIQDSYHEVYPVEAVEFFKNFHHKDGILKDAVTGYIVIAESNGHMLGTGTLIDTTLKRVFVLPSHQHQGIGKLIAEELIRKAELNRLPALYLDASLVSRRFWESMGFLILRETFIPVLNDSKLRYYEMVKNLRS